MGAFERKARQDRERTMQVQKAADIAAELRVQALSQIELDGKDVLPGLRRCLDDEAKAANDNGFRASVSDVRNSDIPEVGSALHFERVAQAQFGGAANNIYTVKVVAQTDGCIYITASKSLKRGGPPQKVLERENLGSFDQWPFPVRIEDYILRCIDESEKR